ncbi:MAG: biopolymer transporter ExbD [Planctomycetota bacterium]|jgi:biopolymer transport protein ExbD|nr:biopolymer transporter ExbD [Planctomycetota bacterium]
MAIKVVCSACSSVHSVNDRLAGREIRCPHCDGFVQVPLPSAAEVREIEEIVEVEVVEDDIPGMVEIVESADSFGGTAKAEVLDEIKMDTRSSEGKYQDEDEEVEEISFPKKELPKDDMDMTPMVDVTFLLLIFFMITASFSSEKVFEEPPPLSDASSIQKQEPINLDNVRVQIDEYNAFTIILPGGDEREASSKQDLLIALSEARAEVATSANDDQLKLIVEAHVECIHAAVISALDAGRDRGFTSFQVQVVEEFQ